MPLLQGIVAKNPGHVAANLYLGQILLKQGDAAGAGYLEKAMACDPLTVVQGCRLLGAFYAARGQTADAQNCFQRAAAQEKILVAADRERARATHNDPLEPHALSPAELAPLREKLSWYAAVERAYLVRKKVQFLPQRPFYVLGVLRRRKWLEGNPQRVSREIAQMIVKRVRLNGKCLVLVFTRSSKWRKPLAKIPDSEIYVGGKKAQALPAGTLKIT